MDPFVYASEWRVLICKECQYAYTAASASAHLKNKHSLLPTKVKAYVLEEIKKLPSLIQNEAGLKDFVFPNPHHEPIRWLAAPIDKQFGCKQCDLTFEAIWKIQNHCQTKHGWSNNWKRGRSRQQRIEASRGRKDVPWRTGVKCQRFFATRAASRWFEVDRNDGDCQSNIVREHTGRRTLDRLEATARRFRKSKKRAIEVTSDKLEPNAWLERTGWAVHLEGLELDRLYAAAGTHTSEDEIILLHMLASLDRVLERARTISTPSTVGLAALFEVGRKEISTKPRMPFDNRLEDDTWTRYKEVWRRLLCIWYRTQKWDDQDQERPPYRMTRQQEDAWDEFEDSIPINEKEHMSSRTDRFCLSMIMSVLDHQLVGNHYESILLSALSVLGISEDGGWVDALSYTTIYSAVIKIARMLVLYQSWLQREDEIEEKEKTMDKEDAIRQSTGLFRLVRGKVRRFMVLVPEAEDAEPTPMDWIYDTRSYGLKIRYTTTANGSISWQGDEVTFKKLRLSMNQLSDGLHTLLEETRSLLAKLTMVDEDGAEGLARLPRIKWSNLEDDHSNDQIGYSFMQDDRNTWLQEGNDWVLNRIKANEKLRADWLEKPGGLVSDSNVVRTYGRDFDDFRQRLWLLKQMVGGMPIRTWETAGLRMVNTANGGLRNVLAHNGMICNVVSYTKNFRSSGKPKIIYRYLPPEVGELVIWYMWIALPFWQTVQGTLSGADECSPYLWANRIVRHSHELIKQQKALLAEEATLEYLTRSNGEVKEQGASEGQANIAVSSEEKWDPTGPYEVWSGDKLRRIMQQHCRRIFGCALNVSAWRHIAIAIANRYLNKMFGESGEEYEEQDDDEDGIDDNIWDSQAGHTSHVASMVYARDMQQGPFSTAPMREKYRYISRRWHRFLGFMLREFVGSIARRVQSEAYDEGRYQARLRRYMQLQHTDIEGQLGRMICNEDAKFRGNQEATIRAIIRGESPILQIMGTGGGKSVSFMLPAYCSPDGVTIVIVPLVALRQDLHERCKRAGIDAHIWQSRGANRAASLVFVTPESAVTKGFGEFLNRLQIRQQLDRIVVDESHTILDSTGSFRPQMKELGRTLRAVGVQLIFLTATLAPQDEMTLFSAYGLTAGQVRVYRTATTRGNIRYRVAATKQDKQDQEVCNIAKAKADELIRNGEVGRIIIYANTIERVEKLGKMLNCPIYHSKVDTAAGKARRLNEWLTGEGVQTIVATNALGLGVDVPNVRLVVHAGMPRKLRDFAQESGRAGRDGGSCEAVVVVSSGGLHSELEISAKEFIEGLECRRVILDRIMDGNRQRIGCTDAEESCDVCRRVSKATGLAGLGRARSGEEEDREDNDRMEEGPESADDEARLRFEGQIRRLQDESRKVTIERMKEAEELEEMSRMLDDWVGRCFICRAASAEDHDHMAAECPQKGNQMWNIAREGYEALTRGVFSQKRLEAYSGCFSCGVPQKLCRRWKTETEDMGVFSQVSGGQCQYSGLLVGVISGIQAGWWVESQEVLQGLLEEEGIGEKEINEDEWFRWLGGKIRWAGVETNRLCRAFYLLNKRWEDEMIKWAEEKGSEWIFLRYLKQGAK